MEDLVKNMLDFYKGKKIFITGHTGFKGSWLTKMLTMAGAQVTGYALEPQAGEPNLFGLADVAGGMNSIIGDIRDYDSLYKAFDAAKPEFVIHMAAQPLVRDSYEMPVYTYETNVMGTVNILECVRNTDCVRSFLNVTTDKVYENIESQRGYVESDKLDGYDPYSNSKSCSELVTHSYKKSFLAERGIAVSTARAGNVIGGGDFAKNRIIPDCVRAAMAKETVVLRNPDSIRPFQWVLEPLFAYLLIMQKQYEDITSADWYNVGPDESDAVTVERLTEMFCNAWGEDASFTVKPDGGPHEAGLLMLNCDKIKERLGWLPKYDIKAAIEKTVEWSKVFAAGDDIRDITEKQINEF